MILFWLFFKCLTLKGWWGAWSQLLDRVWRGKEALELLVCCWVWLQFVPQHSWFPLLLCSLLHFPLFLISFIFLLIFLIYPVLRPFVLNFAPDYINFAAYFSQVLVQLLPYSVPSINSLNYYSCFIDCLNVALFIRMWSYFAFFISFWNIFKRFLHFGWFIIFDCFLLFLLWLCWLFSFRQIKVCWPRMVRGSSSIGFCVRYLFELILWKLRWF